LSNLESVLSEPIKDFKSESQKPISVNIGQNENREVENKTAVEVLIKQQDENNKELQRIREIEELKVDRLRHEKEQLEAEIKATKEISRLVEEQKEKEQLEAEIKAKKELERLKEEQEKKEQLEAEIKAKKELERLKEEQEKKERIENEKRNDPMNAINKLEEDPFLSKYMQLVREKRGAGRDDAKPISDNQTKDAVSSDHAFGAGSTADEIRYFLVKSSAPDNQDSSSGPSW
jgi:vacuolar-type H+-ATPase subunit I/STV1